MTILNPFDKKMKELRTLKQHYYPEGGWGWVIVLVTLIVQLISHGLQLALAMYIMSVPRSSVISRRLLNTSFDQSGKKLLNKHIGVGSKFKKVDYSFKISLEMKVMSVPRSSVISRRLLNTSFDQSGKNITKHTYWVGYKFLKSWFEPLCSADQSWASVGPSYSSQHINESKLLHTYYICN